MATKRKCAKGKVSKFYTVRKDTVDYLKKEFPEFKNGLAIDELVRIHQGWPFVSSGYKKRL